MNKIIKPGDCVFVNDVGLLLMQKFAPKGSNPNNIGIVEEIIDDDTVIVNFPIGNEKMADHSQSAPYTLKDLVKTKTPKWLSELI